MVHVLWEIVVSYKTDILLPYDPAITLLGIYLLKGVENVCPHKNLHTDIYRKFICNCQNLEPAKKAFSRLMVNKQWYIQTMEYYSTKKKWATKPWKDMEEPKMSILSEKSQSEKANTIWYDSSYVGVWKRQNYCLKKEKRGRPRMESQMLSPTLPNQDLTYSFNSPRNGILNQLLRNCWWALVR